MLVNCTVLGCGHVVCAAAAVAEQCDLAWQVLELAKGNKKFAAIDRAIGKDSFKVVLLLRLSPLLPLALSNYLYGLTSVSLGPYVLGSWLGMLPGTLAYVTAGAARPPTADWSHTRHLYTALALPWRCVGARPLLSDGTARKGTNPHVHALLVFMQAVMAGSF